MSTTIFMLKLLVVVETTLFLHIDLVWIRGVNRATANGVSPLISLYVMSKNYHHSSDD